MLSRETSCDQGAIFLCGPTAVGKTSISMRLADELNGEVISVDSMQVYRGLNIGTAKPAPDDLSAYPHHLIDVVTLLESFDAATFCQLAKKSSAEIQARGRVPIFCGGTGLYFKVYLEGIGQAPAADPALRNQLENTPLESLLDELEVKDAVTFGKIDKRNPRRVIRAVEVIRLTGVPFSAQQSHWQRPQAKSVETHLAFGFYREPADLRRRIDARVEEMFAQGLVDETARLLEAGLAENQTAMQAIGYRQVVEHLRGERSLSDTIELVKIRTRQFAKRQLTWFRRQLHLDWMRLEQDTSPNEAAEKIVAKYHARTR